MHNAHTGWRVQGSSSVIDPSGPTSHTLRWTRIRGHMGSEIFALERAERHYVSGWSQFRPTMTHCWTPTPGLSMSLCPCCLQSHHTEMREAAQPATGEAGKAAQRSNRYPRNSTMKSCSFREGSVCKYFGPEEKAAKRERSWRW